MRTVMNPAAAVDLQSYAPEGPQRLLREIAPGRPYPLAALGPLRTVVEAVQDVSQAPVAIAAQSALAAASLAVQGFADVETLGGYAPVSLFCLTIAESGERKSTSDRLVMRALREYERAQSDAYSDAFAAYEMAKEIWEEKRKRLMNIVAGKDKAKADAAEADLRALGLMPRPPLYPNITAMEPTFEGLMKLYGIGRPSLGLFSDEAGAFIGGHAMNRDNRLKTIAGLSQLWDGEPIDRTRAGDGATVYRGRRLAAHLMVQPVAVRPLLADPLTSGQGFLPRFLITEPPSAIGFRLRRSRDPAGGIAIEAFGERLARILSTPMPTTSNPQELSPARLPLAPAAKKLLEEFYNMVEQEQAPGREMEQVRAYASKAAEQAARIAGVLTRWSNLDAPAVTPEAMGWGIQLAEFYLSEARRLAENGLVSEETAKTERLRKWLLEKWAYDDVIKGELLQSGPNELRDLKQLAKPLATLVEAGWLVPLEPGTFIRGAARKEAYRIVRPRQVL